MDEAREESNKASICYLHREVQGTIYERGSQCDDLRDSGTVKFSLLLVNPQGERETFNCSFLLLKPVPNAP